MVPGIADCQGTQPFTLPANPPQPDASGIDKLFLILTFSPLAPAGPSLRIEGSDEMIELIGVIEIAQFIMNDRVY